MISFKKLVHSDTYVSVDGKYWEPAITPPYRFRWRLRDAIAVLRGHAIAVRQTEKGDL